MSFKVWRARPVKPPKPVKRQERAKATNRHGRRALVARERKK